MSTFCFSFQHFVLKCLGPDLPSTYLALLKIDELEELSSNKNDEGRDNSRSENENNFSINVKNSSTDEAANGTFKVVKVLDDNNATRGFINGLACPIIETIENITTKSGRTVRAKMYLPPELRKSEIFKFPMVVHV